MAIDSMKPMRAAEMVVVFTFSNCSQLTSNSNRVKGILPPGTVPTCATCQSSRRVGTSQTKRIPATQLSSGERGPSIFKDLYFRANFFEENKKANQSMPSTNGAGFTSPSRSAMATTSSCTRSVLGSLMPRKYLSWLQPMMMAEPVLKPLMTGWPRNATRKLSRKTQAISSTMPTKIETVTARMTYCFVQSRFWSSDSSWPPSYQEGHCSSLNLPCKPALKMRETIATGPTANCLEWPSKAYTTVGTQAAYMP
mmetsp:Transcript_55640/g.118487  ORF Transcript_55640/g.118487 Transcript_55640/m.118487 type:complete len:253 (-) Transcript_55640:518-1276(-)